MNKIEHYSKDLLVIFITAVISFFRFDKVSIIILVLDFFFLVLFFWLFALGNFNCRRSLMENEGNILGLTPSV